MISSKQTFEKYVATDSGLVLSGKQLDAIVASVDRLLTTAASSLHTNKLLCCLQQVILYYKPKAWQAFTD